MTGEGKAPDLIRRCYQAELRPPRLRERVNGDGLVDHAAAGAGWRGHEHVATPFTRQPAGSGPSVC